MTIANLGDKNNQLLWVIFHIILGLVSTVTPWMLILWVYLLVGQTIFTIFAQKNRDGSAHFFLLYYLGIELLARMSDSFPFLPWESGKYLMMIILIMGLLVERRPLQGSVGVIILLLALPSILVMPKDRFIKDLVFNSIGILNLSLALVYFYRRPISDRDLARAGRLIILGIISVLAYIVVKTPDLSTVEFTLNANFKTAGGFGSNQVSTILGLGFATVAVFNLLKIRLITFLRFGDLLLFGFLFYRGLLTFSRGGILGGVICILAAFVVYTFSDSLPFRKVRLSNAVLVIGVLLTVAAFANQLTGNLLLLRYQGETKMSLAGRGERSYTTGPDPPHGGGSSHLVPESRFRGRTGRCAESTVRIIQSFGSQPYRIHKVAVGARNFWIDYQSYSLYTSHLLVPGQWELRHRQNPDGSFFYHCPFQCRTQWDEDDPHAAFIQFRYRARLHCPAREPSR